MYVSVEWKEPEEDGPTFRDCMKRFSNSGPERSPGPPYFQNSYCCLCVEKCFFFLAFAPTREQVNAPENRELGQFNFHFDLVRVFFVDGILDSTCHW
jgi:hypothetical protein